VVVNRPKIAQELNSVATETHADLIFIQDVRVKAEQAVHDTLAAARIIDGFRQGMMAQSGTQGLSKRDAEFPFE
jgi:exonuclease III